MTDIRYKFFYILIFLIGLNFGGSAILLTYVLLLLSLMLLRTAKRVPWNIMLVVLLLLSISISTWIMETDTLIKCVLKNGVYINIYFSFYFLALYCCDNTKNMEKRVTVFSDCFFSFSFGNMIHLILDTVITDMKSINLGHRVLNDYWSGETTPTTVVMAWGCLLMPLLIYYVNILKGEKIKFIITAVLMTYYVIFSLQIATRFGIVNAVLIMVLYFVLEALHNGIRISASKAVKYGIIGVAIVMIGIKMTPLILKSNLAIRMSKDSISIISGNGRAEASLYLISHWSESIFGGNYFSTQYGLQQHNMLLQIYDLYGLVAFFTLLLIFVVAINIAIKIYQKNELQVPSRVFCVLIVASLILYCFEEPAYTSNYIITSMIFGWIGFSPALLKEELPQP